MARRISVLLGAGASADAGLPLTGGLMEPIIQVLKRREERDNPSGAVETLYFVLGRLYDELGSKGHDPTSGIDVERALTALMLLGRRTDSPLAPFVRQWAPWDRARDNLRDGEDLAKALDKDVANYHVAGAPVIIRQIVADLPTQVFSRTYSACVWALREVLADPDPVDYLRPLLSANAGNSTVIATLNYDSTVETAAANAGVVLDAGTRNFGTVSPPVWMEDADVQLYKLHGSIDWQFAPTQSNVESVQTTVMQIGHGGMSVQPGLILGGENKLRADGPFLDIFMTWRERLSATDDLLVVGYSFRDEHVNEVVGRWMDGRNDRRIVLIDPGWEPEPSQSIYNNQMFMTSTSYDFLNRLFRVYGGFTPSTQTLPPAPRFIHLGFGASEGIPHGLALLDDEFQTAWQPLPERCADPPTPEPWEMMHQRTTKILGLD